MDAEAAATALQPQASAPPQAELDDVQPVIAPEPAAIVGDEERVVLVPPQEPALAGAPSATPAQQLVPTDAAQPQRTREIVEEELASLTKRQLRERAASVGVSRAEIQRAADGATPKRDVSASAHALPSALMVYPCLYRWSG